MKKARLLAAFLAAVCIVSVPVSAQAESTAMDEALASYEQYIDCMDTYIDTGSGLFMKNWLTDGVNHAVVVTDGTPLPADLRDTGFWACTAWTDMDSAIEIIETNFKVTDPENTYILSSEMDGEDLLRLARAYALENTGVLGVYLCELAEYVPCTWSKSFTILTGTDIESLDAADFSQFEELDGYFWRISDAEDETAGIRSWRYVVNGASANEITAQFADTENPSLSEYQYLKELEASLNMDSSVLLAFADFGFPIGSSDSVRGIVLDSAWEGFGDFDSNGAVDSSDAAEMLIRAAALGAADALHTNADLLGDLNNDGELNAADAAAVLTYAAEIGAGSDVSWLDILR